MIFALLLLILATISIILILLRRGLKTHRQGIAYNGVYPSVTVIRPVKGLDVGARENFNAALCTGYPGSVETIFVFDGPDDPAYPVACAVVKEYQENGGKNRVQILVSGPPPAGRTGKLHAMIMGEHAATGELIAFSDSDTRPDQNVLRILVETLLTTPAAGSAFVPVVSDQAIQKAGDVFYALLQNALYAPWALLVAGSSRTLPFIMGQYMVMTRECLKDIGGVACASGQLVDDMYIGKVVHKAGFLNVIAPYSLSIHSSGLSISAFIPIYRKWLQFGKNGLPFSFTWRQWLFCGCFYAALVIAPLAAYQHQWLEAGLATFIVGLFSYGLAYLHQEFGGSPVPLRYWWGPVVMLIFALGVVISNRVYKNVNWRGRVYKLDSHAALNSKA